MIMKLGSAAGIDYTDNTWTNQSVYLEPVNGSDLESGHNTTTYAVSGANTVASTSTSSTIANSGTSIVTVTSTDIAGNIATRTYTVKIDKTVPVAGTMTMKLGSAAGANYTDNTWTNQSIYLAPINGTDALSGHSTTTYVVSGANTIASTSAANTIVNSGTSTVTLTTTDLSGNIATRTYTVKIDKTVPVAGTMTMKLGSAAGANYTDNTWTNQSVYLAPVNGSDIDSGHGSTTYVVSGANTVASTSAANTIVNSGTSIVTLTTTDLSGNTATRTYTVKIDKIVPVAGTMTMKLGSAAGANYTDNTWTTQSIYLAPVNGSDVDSGHSTTTYVVSGANTVASTSAANTIVNSGTSIVTVTTTDNAGNSATRTYTVKIDKVAPTAGTATLRLGSTTGTIYTAGNWTNQNVYVVLSNGSDAESGHNSTTSNYSVVTASGTTTVTVTTTDNAGNSATRNYIVNIDNVAPTAGTATLRLGSTTGTIYTAGNWTNQNVYVILSNGSDALSGHNSTTSNYSVVTASGTTTVTVTTTDNAGNSATRNYIVNIDNVAPTAGTATLRLGSTTGTIYTAGNWTNQNVYVVISNGSDALSGHNSTTSNYSVVTANGTTTVVITTTDMVGNSATRSYNVNIDTIMPTVGFVPNGGSGASVGTNATVSDGQSGAATTQNYLWTTSTTQPSSGWGSYSNGSYLSWSTSGIYYLWIKAYDNAGNIAYARSSSFNIFVADTTPPTQPVITATPTSWTNGNVSVTISYSNDSATKEYSYNASTWTPYSSAITVSNNNTTIYARAKDAALNTSTTANTTVANIDKTPPTATYNVSYAYNVPAARPKVTIADSGGSGVTSQYVWSQSTTAPTSGWTSYTSGNQLYKGGLTSGATWYLWIKATDGAGNVTTVKNTQYYIVPASKASYIVYVSSNKWLNWVSQGTTGGYGSKVYSAGWGPLLMEGIKFSLENSVSESLYFQCHTSNLSWQSIITADGSTQSGNPGCNAGLPKPIYGIEAIKVWLSSTAASKYDVKYRVFTPANNSWSSYVTNGAQAGVTGQNKPISGIEVTIEEKLNFWN